ncbi:hypothetical protein A5760_19635 [Mycobacterium colombiense]|uniref:TIR domain-containing protein n=1 Tax=Mycobacterium colombiense TaxID=339268 RepID=A0A1A0VAT2_9MYCO|nr:toll/interleukin-1 receptor domain-containing protein [Mycobacterium colombiense]OBB80301.1 hypothetical protein A5760_19635 [Mycobacterium colombiense]
MLYDAFISHASEDKDDFVRPLAERMRDQHIKVWFDEFSLRVGDSLRRSIDKGLRQSRFAIVVLSPRFFAKDWPEWELDGLIAREIAERGILLPVWHGVTRDDVLKYSPPLADKLAVPSAVGIEEVVRRLCDVMRPQGSTLVVARDHLIDLGYEPPVVTDDWWLDVAAASESNDMEGGWQSAMGWGRWGFPLPAPSREPTERGRRLARAAMQMQWQNAADDIPITQVTHPDQVHEFIDYTPGLADVCHEYPHYLGVYAPQLTIRGFGGQFEGEFEALYDLSCSRNPKGRCDEQYVLRDPNLATYDASGIACDFVQGYGVISGPSATYYAEPEYIAWLLSDRSRFLPEEIRSVLTVGMAEWGVWPWTESLHRLDDFGYEQGKFDGQLQQELLSVESIDMFHPSRQAIEDAVHRMSFSARLLALPESGDQLAERLLSPQFLAPYFSHRTARRENR